MKLKKEVLDLRKWIILILFTVMSFWVFNNLDIIINFINKLFNVFFPFILGGVIAYILNIPMTKIEKILKKVIKKDNKEGLIRTLAIVLSLLLFIIIIAFIAFLLIPELIENIENLIKNIPGVIDKVEVWLVDILDKYPDIQKQIIETFSNSEHNVSSIVSNILNYLLSSAIGFISNLVSGFITFFTAVIFSIYMLSQKEYLIRCFKKLIYGYLKEDKASKVMEIGALTNKTFSKFISGQCVEAIILGVIIFIALTIFRFPYALIISVLTAVTALIPIFGAIIAMVIGAILIGINNPIQAILFIVVFQIIQQIEGNFIYPKVVGKSVGLSPMWTLLAITAGGSLFGIVGMLIGLPLASVIYALIKESVNNKLKTKKIKI